MSTGTRPRSKVAGIATRCSVCDGDVVAVIDLPGLPLTGRFSSKPCTQIPEGIDQELQYCSSCNHAQLKVRVDPGELYDSTYSFRTSASHNARRGTGFFLSALAEITGGGAFRCAVDVGCNDLYLLEQLPNAQRKVGIDPIWRGKEAGTTNGEITVIGSTIEEAESAGLLPDGPDLLICRHTIEHIANPVQVMETIAHAAAPGALVVLETPGFDALVRRNRFDQVFHQHVQYFSLKSLQRLGAVAGLDFLGYRENYHDWGALFVAFRKPAGRGRLQQDLAEHSQGASGIRDRYRNFKQQMACVASNLRTLAGETTYGYGAAQMLPVLAYHLETDFCGVKAVLDDDPAKDGLYYWNLPVGIRASGKATDLQGSTVIVTAVDNVGPIMAKLLAKRPRHIILPLSVI